MIKCIFFASVYKWTVYKVRDTGPHLTRVSLGHSNPHPKQHLDHINRFSTTDRVAHVCNVSSQQLAKIWLKLHKSQTDGKGIVKTCTVMRKGKELNRSIGSTSLHPFVQRLLVPSVRQQVAKPQVLMRSVEESIRMTEDRDKWRKCIHGVANPRIEDG